MKPLPNIGAPATRALEAAGYLTLESLTNTTEACLLDLHGVGPKAIRIIKEAFQKEDLSFRDK